MTLLLCLFSAHDEAFVPKQSKIFSSKRVYCPHCSMQVQQRTYDEHRHNFYNEVTKQWSSTKDNSTHNDDSKSDVTSQSSEPNSDIDVSSPDEHISSPDIQDIYTGLDSLTGADKDGDTMTHRKVQMKSTGMRVMKIMK